MTFAAVGTVVGGEGTGLSSFSLAPHSAGDLILIEVVCYGGTTVHPTALSSSNVTWSAPWTPFSGSTNPYAANVFMGKVTATSAATVTISFSGSVSGVVAWSGHEFSSTAGSWAKDGSQGNLDSAGTASWPSLTPSQAGDIYFGYSFSETGSSSAGSTSGYTYSTNADSLGDCLAYNPACGSGATFPVWGSSDQGFGIMVLVKETGGASGAGDPAQIRPGRTWLRYHKPWVPQRPQVPPPDLAAPAPPPPPPSQDGPPLALPGPAWLRFHKPWLRAGRPLMPQPSDAGAVPPVPPPPPAFPDVPLDLTCQLDLPADGWTDVTGDVYQRDSNTPVTVTRGRPDESSQVNPSSAAFQLNNRSGDFTVKNPLGAYYGQLNRNTPVRFSVPAAGTNYLRLEEDTASGASCPSTSALNVSGDLDIRLDLDLSGYSPCLLASKYATSSAYWYLSLGGDGTLLFGYYDTLGAGHGGTSTVPVPLGRVAIRVTLQVSNGAGAHVYTFYTAPGISGPWTQLGAAVVSTSGTSPIVSTTAPVAVGYSAQFAADQGIPGPSGAVYAFQMLSGIGGGVVANAGFTAQPAGTTSFADGRGNTWTLSGTAEISDRDYRYHGEMASLPVAWDPSGNDWWVPVTAGGLLRRLGQGNAPVYSAMRRAVLNLSGALKPLVYWPCEDLGGADAFGPAIGAPLMQIYGTPTFAGSSSFACSAALPTADSSVWYGTVPAYTSNGSIIVRFLMDLSSPPATGTPLVRLITTGTYSTIDIVSSGFAGGYAIYGYVSGQAFPAFNTIYEAFGYTQAWVSVEILPSGGGNLTVSLVMLEPGTFTGLDLQTSPQPGAAGNLAAVYVNPSGAALSGAFGHIYAQSQWESLFDLYQPLDAWQGELAGNRFARLCSENGFRSRIYGFPDVTAAMGQQGAGTLTSLLQECESADLGQIYEPRQALALGYRTLAALCNQAVTVTLDYSAAVLGGTGTDLVPTYDDQYTRNDYVVQQGSQSGSSSTQTGGSYRAFLDDGSPMSISPPDEGGVGDYSDTATANVASTGQLPDIGWWLVHLGTVDDYRWPGVPVNMGRAEVAGVAADVQACQIGDYVIIANPPDRLPPDDIRQIIAQSVEVLGGFRWTLVFSCIPESPYETGLYDDPVYGRGDTDGSELASGTGTADATLSVSATGPSGLIWTTSAGDFPFDIGIGGEQMTVTDITGSSSPQSFTVTRSVNGVVKSHSAGDDVRLWTPPVYALQ